MPIYEYRCDRGHTFEVLQRISDDPLTACERCEAPVRRVFHPVAVHFKGSGFYSTDYGKKRGAASSDGADGGGSDSKPESAGDKKPDAGSEKAKADSSKAGSGDS